MTQTTLRQKRKFSVNRAIGGVVALAIVFVSGVLIFNSAKEWFRYYESSQTLQTVQQELSELEEKQAALEATKDKLSNPDYVQNFARGVHLMSKSEEQIFVLPKADE
ncbi:hypothetical protein AOC36_11455 [Erysipelothrix larvae]|uniref:Septum formation initiator n=1 Tax=Erysipelothrix larvae TaxID=1514105 RepID=A0A0X8H204_9FIRM|nr:septum formation initiator family protein [Erysipelothrix larvae]AMC94565.1 hypothetical protein AOC36_11455 [Erysipelothrix larvae]